MQIAFIARSCALCMSLSTAGACVSITCANLSTRLLILAIRSVTYRVAFYEPLGFQRQQRFSKPSPQGTIEVAFPKMGASSELYQLPAGTPLTPLAAVSIIWRWKSATDAVQQRLAAPVIRSMKGR